jgi:hypothetical protein
MTKASLIIITRVLTRRLKKTSSSARMRATILSLIFVLSGIGAGVLISPAVAAPNAQAAAPVAAAAPLTQAEANWEFPNGNQFNQNYNPQNQINSGNAQSLGLDWIYPLGDKPAALNGFGSGGVGVGMPVIVVNGTAFATTVFDETIAFNIANGNVIWTYMYPLSLNATLSGSAPLSLHSHDGNEWFSTATFGSGVSGPTLWLQGQNFVVYAINALSGKQELNFTDFTGLSMVAGNSPTSIYHDVGASNIVIDAQRGILVSGHDAEAAANNGRGFFAGWNLNAKPPTIAWLAYTTPPQAGGNLPVDPNWAIKDIANMSHAYSFDPGKGAANGYTTPEERQGGVLMNTNDNIVVNWKTLPQSQLNATLYNDWGQANQSPQCQAVTAGMSTGSTGSGWGGAWLAGSGPTSGMVFVSTNNKDPYVGPCTPGPNLWAASILALNVTNGHWIWGFQAVPHDLWDWDCSWWQAMGNETINGATTPVIFKTCKSGYLFEINALTGALIWSWNPPSSNIPRCNVCYMWSVLNSTQMNFDFPTAMLTFKNQSMPITGPQPAYLEFPGLVAGFEDVNAFNPATNTIIAAAHNVPNTVAYTGLNATTYFSSSGEIYGPFNAGGLRLPEPQNANATVFAINGATGAIKWNYFIPNQGYRGGLSVSGNLVFLTLTSGDLLMVNQSNGALVRDYYIGAPMDEPASIGASIAGQVFVILPVGTCSLVAVVTCPGTTPGDILALSLQGQASATTTTVTASGSVSTTTTTVTASGSVSTTTTTASGGATTTTTTSGFSAATVYGLVAVAVIFIIATGVLAMRGRRRPAAT